MRRFQIIAVAALMVGLTWLAVPQARLTGIREQSVRAQVSQPSTVAASAPAALTAPQQVATAISTTGQTVSPRQLKLYSLMASNPEEAYENMATNRANEGEDAPIPVCIRGSWEVQVTCGKQASQITRVVTDSKTGLRYEAFTWGSRMDDTSHRDTSMVGFTIGDRIVVHPESGHATRAKEEAQRIGALGWADILTGIGSIFGGGSSTVVTTGNQSILYIRARFSDEAADFEPVSLATAQVQLDKLVSHMDLSSYGQLALTYVITDTLTLPQTVAESAYSTFSFSTLVTNATAVAKQANTAWDSSLFTRVIVVTADKPDYPYVGVSAIGGNSMHVVAPNCDLRTLGHELGHNLGLYHANFWNTKSVYPNGKSPGGKADSEVVEYGHRFSLMGGQNENTFDNQYLPHFAGKEKLQLGWLKTTDIVKVSQSGTYRLYALDATEEGTRAICIDRVCGDKTGAPRKYWLNFRSLFFTPPSPHDSLRGSYAPYGIQLDWATDTYGNLGKAVMNLDTTPKSQLPGQHTAFMVYTPDQTDGVIVLGRTYSDSQANIHITPLGLDPQGKYIDVKICLDAEPTPITADLAVSSATAAIGEAITFHVTTSQPNPTFSWDFSDQNLVVGQLNQAQVSHSWGVAGEYMVTATVYDGQGGSRILRRVIQVGGQRQGLISGRVLAGGDAKPGVMIRLNEAQTTWSNDDGTFTFCGLPGGNYNATAYSDGNTLLAKFTNQALQPGQRSNGQDFWVTNFKTDGLEQAYTVAGQLTDPLGQSLSGVEVSLQGWIAKCDSTGRYSFPRVPPGTYEVSVNHPFPFTPKSARIVVSASHVTGVNFVRQVLPLRGTIEGLTSSQRPRVVISAGLLAVVTWNGTAWDYIFQVPAGKWTVAASALGYVITPKGSNAAMVSDELTPAVDFQAAVGSVGAVTGYIPNGRYGLPGVTISSAGQTTLTDSMGYYVLANLPIGVQTVTASKAGTVFSVASKKTTVRANTTNTGVYFTLKTPDVAPSFAQYPKTSASTVTGIGSKVTLTALGKDALGEASLSYNWADTSGTTLVQFSPNNGTNSAKSIEVTFLAVGTYTLRCTINDLFFNSASSNVTVTVKPQRTGQLSISPFLTYITSGESQSYTTTGWDEAGQPFSATGTWSTTAGSISSGGILTQARAGTVSAVGAATATVIILP